MNSISFVVTIILSISAIKIYGYPDGAPEKACNGSMLPHHHHHEPQPSSTSPVKKFETTWNADKNTISIQMEFTKHIKGIFVQGRTPNGTEPIGTFIDLPTGTRLVECSSGKGVTHDSPQKWTQIKLTWKKPGTVKKQEDIQFWATVLVDFEHFWLVKSSK